MTLECLPPDELHQIAETKNRGCLIRWLEEHQIPYLPSAKGTPRVLRIVLMQRLGLNPPSPPPTPKQGPQLHIPTRKRNGQETHQG